MQWNSPPEFCISDQYSGIAGIFAELPYRQPGEDFRITVHELIQQVHVCVGAASFLQVHQIRPTRLRGICVDDLVEGERHICEGRNGTSPAKPQMHVVPRAVKDVTARDRQSRTLHSRGVPCVVRVEERGGGVHGGLLLPRAMRWTDSWRLRTQWHNHVTLGFFNSWFWLFWRSSTQTSAAPLFYSLDGTIDLHRHLFSL